MSAKRPARKATTRAPMRKPVAGTPPWVMPAAVVAGIALLVAAFLVYRYYTTPQPLPTPNPDVTSQVLTIITTLPASEFDSIGQGSADSTLLKPASGSGLTGSTGKPQLFYYGAEFCPYCAAQRWPVIIALSRFGTFTGLQTTSSSSSDVYPNTVTFSFRNAKFTSQHVDFAGVETTDRDQNPLQSPTAAQHQLVSQYDTSGTIPFLDYGNRNVSTGAYFSPDVITGMSWLAVADSLQQTDSPQARAIVGSANLVTAAICKMAGDEPSTVCTSATIQGLEKNLK